MTREEAIKVLEMFLHKQCDLDRTKFAYDQNTVWEAVNMASKALEHEPCEDAVSRQALYEALYERFHDEDSPNNITEVRLGAVRNFVKDFPPVTPTRKKGKWIDTKTHQFYDDGEIETTELRCSCCNEIVEWDIELSHKPHYCENCGAEMESEE